VKPDDPDVEGSEILYRYSPRIPHRFWTVTDQQTQQVYITIAALSWDKDGISCYRERILHQNQMDWRHVKREPPNGIFSLAVQDVRDEMLGVAYDPLPESEEPHPRRIAHTLIVDKGTSKKQNKPNRERLAHGATIIHHGELDESP
jgi:hypothetical protein